MFPHFTGFVFFTREPVGELSLYFFSCITLIYFYFELNIYGRLPTIPTKIVPEKKLKGRHWKDEISALTSVSLGSSGDLLLGLQKSAVVATFLKRAPSISLYDRNKKKKLKNNGRYHDTLIKFNHDSNYDGDEFISFWNIIIA
jgi:hypothetical protein